MKTLHIRYLRWLRNQLGARLDHMATRHLRDRYLNVCRELRALEGWIGD